MEQRQLDPSGPAADEADISSIPKIELHVHFGGNVEPGLASELARRHGLDPDRALPLEGGRYPMVYRDFPHFLASLIAVNSVVRTPEDVEVAAAAIARTQAAQGVVYTELIVTALSHVRAGIDPRDFWAALTSGLSVAGPTCRFNIIVDAIRNDGPGDLEATLRLIDDADAPIVAVALTGVEDSWPIDDFAFIRAAADRRGLGIEVHAGEMGPPSSIIDSLDVLGADRIGHGVAAIHDPSVLQRIIRDQTPIEVCPTSNVHTGLFPSLAHHPVGHYWDAGVNMTISSDDPALFGTTLTDELREVVARGGLGRHDLAELQRRAARAAFLPERDKLVLEQGIDAWVAGATGA